MAWHIWTLDGKVDRHCHTSVDTRYQSVVHWYCSCGNFSMCVCVCVCVDVCFFLSLSLSLCMDVYHVRFWTFHHVLQYWRANMLDAASPVTSAIMQWLVSEWGKGKLLSEIQSQVKLRSIQCFIKGSERVNCVINSEFGPFQLPHTHIQCRVDFCTDLMSDQATTTAILSYTWYFKYELAN